MHAAIAQSHTPDERKFRVVVTKDLPGERWLKNLLHAGCQVDICKHDDTILSQDIIKKLIGSSETHAVLGQLTEVSRSNCYASQAKFYTFANDGGVLNVLPVACSNGTRLCSRPFLRLGGLCTATTQ